LNAAQFVIYFFSDKIVIKCKNVSNEAKHKFFILTALGEQ